MQITSPIGTTATFATTTVGSSSTTLFTGIPRATQYTPTSIGTITDILLYLTGSELMDMRRLRFTLIMETPPVHYWRWATEVKFL